MSSDDHSTFIGKKVRALQKKLRGLKELEEEIKKSGKPATLDQQQRLGGIPFLERSIKDLKDINSHFQSEVVPRSNELDEFIRLLHASNLIHVSGYTPPKDAGAIGQVLAGKEVKETDLDGLSHFIQTVSGVIRNPAISFNNRVTESTNNVRKFLVGESGTFGSKISFHQLHSAATLLSKSSLAAEPPSPAPVSAPSEPAPVEAATSATPSPAPITPPAEIPVVPETPTESDAAKTETASESAPADESFPRSEGDKKQRRRGRGGRGRGGAVASDRTELGEVPKTRPDGEGAVERGTPGERGGRRRGPRGPRGPRPEGDAAAASGAPVAPPGDKPAPVPREDRPQQERPREDRPRQERPRENRPQQERPREDRPRQERPQEDRPREDRPREDRPREERPREDRPAGPKPGNRGRGRGRARLNGPRPGNVAPAPQGQAI